MMVNESAVKVNSATRQRAPPVYFSPPHIPRGSLTQKRAEYLDSDVHKKYLKKREDILKDITENKAEKDAKIAQIDQEILKI